MARLKIILDKTNWIIRDVETNVIPELPIKYPDNLAYDSLDDREAWYKTNFGNNSNYDPWEGD